MLLKLKQIRKIEYGHQKPALDHYYLEHIFRAKNGFNALRLATYTFYLDKNLKVTGYDTKSMAELEDDEVKERNKILEDIKKLNSKYN